MAEHYSAFANEDMTSIACINQRVTHHRQCPLLAQSSQIRHAPKQRKYQLESELIHQERVIDGSEGGYGNEGTALAASFPLKPE
ncbi:hypothetical protein [Pectobacterium punjabense]|uniref:hypothetical protein n=1 Tax=Pectobacterium punjabense TaxID=2108399 RepID=UPI003801B79C